METLLSKGRRVHGTRMTLVYRKADFGKCAVVASKKVAHTAVARHTLRRRVFTALANNVLWRKGYHIAVIARPGLLQATPEELEHELQKLLSTTQAQ